MQNITKLLRLEWLKFGNNIVFKTVMIIFTFGFPFIILLGKKILGDAPPPIPSSSVLYEFPTVWDYQGYVGNWFVSILLGFLVIYMFTSEVSFKTMRQNILTGLTRKEYFQSKFYAVVALSIYATIIYYISCILLGLTHTDIYDVELIFDNNFAGVRFFIMSMGYLTFALLVANLIRRGILSILLYIAYVMAIEVIARLIIIFKLQTRLINFAPLNSIEDVMPNPFLKIPEMALFKELQFKFLLTYNEAVTSAIIYTAVFIWGGWFIFKKKDL